jgi:hypothetical protein
MYGAMVLSPFMSASKSSRPIFIKHCSVIIQLKCFVLYLTTVLAGFAAEKKSGPDTGH